MRGTGARNDGVVTAMWRWVLSAWCAGLISAVASVGVVLLDARDGVENYLMRRTVLGPPDVAPGTESFELTLESEGPVKVGESPRVHARVFNRTGLTLFGARPDRFGQPSYSVAYARPDGTPFVPLRGAFCKFRGSLRAEDFFDVPARTAVSPFVNDAVLTEKFRPDVPGLWTVTLTIDYSTPMSGWEVQKGARPLLDFVPPQKLTASLPLVVY